MKSESAVYPELIEILGDKVYIRSNVEKSISNDIEGTRTKYVYDQIVINKNEFVKATKELGDDLENAVIELAELIVGVL